MTIQSSAKPQPRITPLAYACQKQQVFFVCHKMCLQKEKAGKEGNMEATRMECFLRSELSMGCFHRYQVIESPEPIAVM